MLTIMKFLLGAIKVQECCFLVQVYKFLLTDDITFMFGNVPIRNEKNFQDDAQSYSKIIHRVHAHYRVL